MKLGSRVAGKVAIITGSASGIGRATAELFASEGARVLVADLNGPGAERVAEGTGPSVGAWGRWGNERVR